MERCSFHSNFPTSITITNNAFAGVVLVDSVNEGGNDSSSDHTVQAAAANTKFQAPVMVLGDNSLATTGLTELMGVDERTYKDLTEGDAIKKIVSEFKNARGDGRDRDLNVVNGLINGTYYNPRDDSKTMLLSLSEIMSSLEVLQMKKYGLQSHHVLAIRVYTTICHEAINEPMRTHNKQYPTLPHPFAATLYYITKGLKVLRKAAGDDKKAADQKVFWRGMADVGLADDFTSGTETSCMSTSENPDEAVSFANSAGFVFQVVCNDYFSRGASIQFLSVYPEEEEVLYPPLTYLNIDRMPGAKEANKKAQKMIDTISSAMAPPFRVKVVTVRPAYPDS